MLRLRQIALWAGSALTLSYTAAVASEVSPSRYRQIRFQDGMTPGFSQSKTIRQLVNPRSFGGTADCYEQTIELPMRLAESFPSEILLASLVRGFFGSWIFWPEGVGLRIVRIDVGEFSALRDVPPGKSYWSVSDIPGSSLPNLYSILFGIIHLVDFRVEGDAAFVDLAFGSDERNFSGCPRFSVRRNGLTQVTLKLECFACDPLADVTRNEGWLKTFHTLYSKTLFSAALGRVERDIQSGNVV